MMDGHTLLTVLRVSTMLVFIAVFVGIAVWLLRPSSRRTTEEQARLVLRDDDGPESRA
ncbi:MAG TPA: cbb3-type cytochrome c oxidase subunit 3 [Roseococcus sp.]|jgi:cbb3-type cytochrome oxidase subunit 3|nr:cbb3-type cytochrome c oxidase subunit 3 [Roseococcus sp.]